uniref:hypothetical protein n=1 Tax=Prevotella fusca TaxID=589436 RepID=UPI003FA13832
MARKNSLTSEIRALEKGQSAIFPIERLATVQSSASREGLISGRVYTTEADRENRTITVTRKK